MWTLSNATIPSPPHKKLQVALRLARLLASANHSVTSVIRDISHAPDIREVGAKPLVLSLEDSPLSVFSHEFADKNVVVFSAGAGGKGGPERTKKVDYEGALKVFDAIEQVNGPRPRLIMVSGVDVRDPNHVPPHYVCGNHTSGVVLVHHIFTMYRYRRKWIYKPLRG